MVETVSAEIRLARVRDTCIPCPLSDINLAIDMKRSGINCEEPKNDRNNMYSKGSGTDCPESAESLPILSCCTFCFSLHVFFQTVLSSHAPDPASPSVLVPICDPFVPQLKKEGRIANQRRKSSEIMLTAHASKRLCIIEKNSQKLAL